MTLTARQRSIHNKIGTKKSASFKGKRTRKGSEGEFLVTNAPSDLRSVAYPGGAVALAILLTARIISALWGQIHDCDETYNYWEPLHYLVYGSGLQTWEYSSAYAIRSYLPLWLFALPAKILSYVMAPVSIFYTIRVTLAIFTASAELMFYKAVCQEFGVHVGRMWLAATASSAGGAAVCAALLPSAASHALSTAAAAAWWRRRLPAAVCLTAASALLSWPFTALLGVPIAIDMIFLKGQLRSLINWSLTAAALILIPSIIVDSYHYGRLVVAPWNILYYNIFSDQGPDLYGVEPWTYYFVNGFLNLNIFWVGAVAAPLLLAATARLGGPRPLFCTPLYLALAPLYAWLAVFLLQPHKEERFLYPVYSMAVLAGAVSADCVQKATWALWCQLAGRPRCRHYLADTAPQCLLLLAVAALAGISRSVALHRNYSAPMSILHSLPAAPGSAHFVCFGKEWHRSPSSFHLPSEGYEIRFIKSEFNGQMPAPYSKMDNATRLTPEHFNNKNQEDSRSYLRAEQCHYLVDSDVSPPSRLQPRYKSLPRWSLLAAMPLLNTDASHPLARAFYLPWLSDKYLQFGELHLLKNNDPIDVPAY